MARTASVAIGGYYPTPAHLIPMVAGLINPQPAFEKRKARYSASWETGTYCIIDPCAGDGAALKDFTQALFGYNRHNEKLGQPELRAVGCELEKERFQKLEKLLQNSFGYHATTAVQADALTLSCDTGYERNGANILYLNPPYDYSKAYGRTEHAFLTHFTPALLPDEGILVFIVPHYALAVSATYIAEQYEDVSCFRFPDKDFTVFKQVVLVARRVKEASDVRDTHIEANVRKWAEDAESIPVLPPFPQPILKLEPFSKGGFNKVAPRQVDWDLVLREAQGWMVGAAGTSTGKGKGGLLPMTDVGVHKTIQDFIGHEFPVAMPPKPGHLALALASGMLNGKRLEPDEPDSGLPALIAKGVYKRDYETVQEHANKKGETTSMVQIQQPTLTVKVLNLETYTIHDLASGSEPTGETDVSKMNVADLILRYSQSLMRLMASQFPALHNPVNPAHQLPLARLAREPFRVQAQAIMAAIKLLAQGENPWYVAEVGTGKTTCALYTYGLLSPAYFPNTVNSLKAIGINTARLKPIKRVVVLVPPHLLSTWQQQIHAVLPGAHIVLADSISAIDAGMAYEPPKVTPVAPAPVVMVENESESAPEPLVLMPTPIHFGNGNGNGKKSKKVTDGQLSLWDVLSSMVALPETPKPVSVPKRKAVATVQESEAEAASITPGEGMVFFLLTSSDAKLGHALSHGCVTMKEIGFDGTYRDEAGVRCPKCHGLVVDAEDKLVEPKKIANLRLRCQHFPRYPMDAVARQAQALAWSLVRVAPDNRFVHGLTQQRMMDKYRSKAFKVEVKPSLPVERLTPILVQITQSLREAYDRECADTELTNASDGFRRLAEAWGMLALACLKVDKYKVKHLAEKLFKMVKVNRYALVQEIILQVFLASGDDELIAKADKFRDALLEPYTAKYYDNTKKKIEQLRKGIKPSYSYSSYSYEATFTEMRWHETGTGLTADIEVTYKDCAAGTIKAALTALEGLYHAGTWQSGKKCDEPLYQSTPNPRRFPLAKYLTLRYKNKIDGLIGDESHEFNDSTSAQARAFERLANLGKPVVLLTGTVMNGKASSLFANLQAVSRRFREQFSREDKQAFIRAYGLMKVLVKKEEDTKPAKVTGRGIVSDRVELDEGWSVRVIGEAPGIMPHAVLDHLMRHSIFMHKSELDEALPELTEERITIEVSDDDTDGCTLVKEYARLQNKVLQQIKDDMRTPLSGKLMGALAHLIHAPDLMIEDVGNCVEDGTPAYVIRYPAELDLKEDEREVARAALFPKDGVTPKEAWVLEKVDEELKAGRNVLLFVEHTGDGARRVKRYQRLIKEKIGIKALFMDAGKVSTDKREAWIQQEVVDKDCRVMLVNPVAVQTGLNNLVHFHTAIWTELNYKPTVYVQANGRLHRVGQNKPVHVYYPIFRTQKIALDLIAKKVATLQSVQGMDIESALQESGADDEARYLAAKTAMSFGAAIYSLLTEGKM